MTLLYLRYRARMALSLLKPQTRKDWGYRILIVGLAIYSIAALSMMYWGVHTLFAKVAAAYGVDALARLLYLPAAGYGVFLLFLVLNRVYPTLFESSDHELLRSLPIAPPRLTHLRLTGLAILLSPILLFLVPFAVFYGMEVDAAAGYYAISSLLMLLYGLAIVSLGSVVTSALAAVMASPRLRALTRHGTAVVLIPCGLAMSLSLSQTRQAMQVMQVMDQALAIADRLAFGPSAWFVNGLTGAAAGMGARAVLPGAALVLCIAVCWGGSLALSPRIHHRDIIDAQTPKGGVASSLGWWAPTWLSSPGRALWRREMTAVRVEAPRTLLGPVVMVLLFAVMDRFTTAFFPASYMLGFMSIVLTSGMTMPAMGQEGRAFWILRSLPVPMWKVLVVKLTVRMVTGLVALALLTGLVVTISPPPPLPIEGRLLTLAISMGVVALILSGMWGLATGARFPNFTPSRAGQYVGVGASLAGTFGSMGIAVTLGLSLLPLHVTALRPVLWFLPLAMIAFWAGVVLLYLAWACWHLERLEL